MLEAMCLMIMLFLILSFESVLIDGTNDAIVCLGPGAYARHAQKYLSCKGHMALFQVDRYIGV